MAHSVDSFHDLKELGINFDDANNSLTTQFDAAANHLQKLLPKVDVQMVLTLYGYYKQATEGTCNIPKPSWYDSKGKAKWDAWSKLGSMSQIEAKKLYVENIKKLDPTFGAAEEEAPKEFWVKVSTMQNITDVPNSSKTIVDFIKEGNLIEVTECLKILPENLSGCCFNTLDKEGLGLIHWAADSGFAEVLNVLISSGANVDLQDVDGQTALHYAASCGHIECVELLLASNARTDLTDNDGLDPRSVANDEAVKELFK